jgi:hypothetical protein
MNKDHDIAKIIEYSTGYKQIIQTWHKEAAISEGHFVLIWYQ